MQAGRTPALHWTLMVGYSVIFLLLAMLMTPQSPEWLTHAERSGFQETSRYAETVDYCKRLQAASPWIRYSTFGKSPEGRDLPLLVISEDGHFTPEQAHKSDRAILLIINGIHSGEIAGKEASLMLLRDIAVEKQKPELLKHVVLLVVPIFNVDGHERMSPFNRINQNGPREMGWRGTSQNLNLNRDWIKADQPEMQAMLKLFNDWLPDLVIDNHVSDGADFQYDITWLLDDNPRTGAPLLKYIQNDLEPYLLTTLNSSGHVASRYFEMRDSMDPAAGIDIGPATARFSNGYGTLRNRPTFVVETHMLKSFETRIKAHYDFMQAVLRKLNGDPESLRKAVRQSDEQTIQLPAKYPIRLRENHEKSEPFAYHGIEYTRQQSAISGSTSVTYGVKPIEITIPFYRTMEPEITVDPPLGYIIPPQWTAAIDRLDVHTIAYSRLSKPVTSDFETYRFSEVSWDREPFEGHHLAHFKSKNVKEQRTLPEGSVVVWLNQKTNKVILEMLEPDAADSLVTWGYFDAIFEQKEYAEGYVLEKLAAEMMQKDSLLTKEFEDRLKSDSQFAGDPSARLLFFFERSPYADPLRNAYPVVRITNRSQVEPH